MVVGGVVPRFHKVLDILPPPLVVEMVVEMEVEEEVVPQFHKVLDILLPPLVVEMVVEMEVEEEVVPQFHKVLDILLLLLVAEMEVGEVVPQFHKVLDILLLLLVVPQCHIIQSNLRPLFLVYSLKEYEDMKYSISRLFYKK
jgi:hypothetical protein